MNLPERAFAQSQPPSAAPKPQPSGEAKSNAAPNTEQKPAQGATPAPKQTAKPTTAPPLSAADQAIMRELDMLMLLDFLKDYKMFVDQTQPVSPAQKKP